MVPLCVPQHNTPQAQRLLDIHDVTVWWAAPVEIASALARLLRMRQINVNQWTKALEIASLLAESWSVIEPTESLRGAAVRLVERHHLKAADSLQLAAALEWCEGAPEGRVFLTADQQLHGAALLAGFDSNASLLLRR